MKIRDRMNEIEGELAEAAARAAVTVIDHEIVLTPEEKARLRANFSDAILKFVHLTLHVGSVI